jgi:hypothetical protein
MYFNDNTLGSHARHQICCWRSAGKLPRWNFPLNFTGLFLQSNKLSGSIPANWELNDNLVYLQVTWGV